MSGAQSASRFVEEAQRLRNEYGRTLAELEQVRGDSQAQLADMERRTAAALDELVAVLLPELSPQALQRAVQLTGYTTLLQNDPGPRMAQARRQLEARVAEIEADRRYRDRLLLRAPRIGMLVRDVSELEEFRAPLAELREKMQHPRLERLLLSGYGTDKYQVGFWRLSYYQDWKAADEIVARFPAGKSFDDLCSEYLNASSTIAVYDAKLQKLRDEIRAGEQLEEEHDTKRAQINDLPQVFLKSAREQLTAYLRDLDLVSIGDRLSFDPQLEGLAKRYFGLRKQLEYLRETEKHLIENSRAAVMQTLSAMDRDLNKYRRAKYSGTSLPTARFDRLRQWQQRHQRYRGQIDRYQDTRYTIVSFNQYDYGRLDEDFLWWDLITRGRMNGQYIDEVSHFHSSHPGYRYHAPPDLLHDDAYLGQAEARAAAARAHAQDRQQLEHDIS